MMLLKTDQHIDKHFDMQYILFRYDLAELSAFRPDLPLIWKKWGNLGKIVSKSDKNQTKALSTIFELFLTIFKDAELNEHIKINV